MAGRRTLFRRSRAGQSVRCRADGLIYVNPEGPNGNPDPIAAARDIRETFARMAMNDEETVALIAGGHTFGKTHGAGEATHVGAAPEGEDIVAQGLGWHSTHGTGIAGDAITSGLEVTWTTTPTKWNQDFFKHLFDYEWELTKSPAGAHQWQPKNARARTRSRMRTTSRSGAHPTCSPPIFRCGSILLTKRSRGASAIIRTSSPTPLRGRGSSSRTVTWVRARAILGPEVPAEQLIWQDPVPAVDHPLIDEADIAALKAKILASGLTVQQLVSTAWASASTFRGSDKRGGANGARIRLAPQKDWEVNEPAQLAGVLKKLEGIQKEFNDAQPGGKKVSLADLIVLGGAAGVELAAKNAGHSITVPFSPGRTDASQEQTDVASFAPLAPPADGFRNYLKGKYSVPAETLLVDKAQLLTLTAPEMTVLVGGLRVLGGNVGQTRHGVFTERPEALTNDFFVNLLDMRTEWKAKTVTKPCSRRATARPVS
jgi:catalase-peroxidase